MFQNGFLHEGKEPVKRTQNVDDKDKFQVLTDIERTF